MSDGTESGSGGVADRAKHERLIRGNEVTLRPTTTADKAALRTIREEPEVARWWGPQSAEWPDDADDLELLTIEVDGEVAGLVRSSGRSRMTTTGMPTSTSC